METTSSARSRENLKDTDLPDSFVMGGSSDLNNVGEQGATETERATTSSPPLPFAIGRAIGARQRIQSAKCPSIQQRIQQSKSHWSVLTKPDSPPDCKKPSKFPKILQGWLGLKGPAELDNVEVFKALQSHRLWGRFFKTFGYDLGVSGCRSAGLLEVGEKFAEGAQAELFHAQVTWRDSKLDEWQQKERAEWVVKVFKKGTLLRYLKSQLPHGYLRWRAEVKELRRLGKPLGHRYHCNVHCLALLEDGRFAFLMIKEHEDLRSLIDRNVLESGYGRGPFPKEKAEDIMYRVALGMSWLHSNDIVHRDLKASNVLVREYAKGRHWVVVADFECSIGVVGTGFFRAPEILQACREGNVTEKHELFTRGADVYSYGMTCYEILTGELPFQHHPLVDQPRLLTDHVISGIRPEVPGFVDDWTRELLQRCWQPQPAARPSFGEILSLLEANSDAKFIKQEVEKRAHETQIP